MSFYVPDLQYECRMVYRSYSAKVQGSEYLSKLVYDIKHYNISTHSILVFLHLLTSAHDFIFVVFLRLFLKSLVYLIMYLKAYCLEVIMDYLTTTEKLIGIIHS